MSTRSRSLLLTPWHSPWFSLVSPLLLLGFWYWLCREQVFSEQLLVSPLGVWHAVIELTETGELWQHLSVSLGRLFLGFAIGATLGVGFGVFIALSRTAEQFVAPLFHVLRQLPSVALIPMFILIFGIGETFKVFIVLESAFFIVSLATYDGIKSIPAAYFEVTSVWQIKGWTLFRRLLLPASIPMILTGFRLALSRSWLVLVGAELLAAESGLGQMMEMSRQIFRMDIVMLGAVITGLIGFFLDRGFKQIEKLILHWNPIKV